jgi:hypothetical protein
MLNPFVGRARELRRLRRLLEAGRNIVVTGSYGSGRTTLIHRLETQLDSRYRFVFVCPSDTRAAVRAAVADATSPADVRPTRRADSMKPSRVVVVFDDVVRLTAQRARFIRQVLDDERVRMILIAERTLIGDSLVRVRAMLGAAPVVHVGPLSDSEVEQYVAACVNAAGIAWRLADLRGMARSTNGYALGMRLTVEAALQGAAARAQR